MDKQTQKELLNTVRKNYNEIGEQFSETRSKRLWPELISLASSVQNGSKVLDAGCGNGRLLEALKEKRINYLGVDTSEKLIEIAKEKYPEHKFIVSDILELGNIPQLNFDFVFCIAVLSHLPGKELRIAALKQLKNKISQNGKIILSVWNLWNTNKLKKTIFRFALLKIIGKNKLDFGDILFDWKDPAGQAVSRRYYHAFTKGELKETIKKAGLKIEKLYKDDYNYYAIIKK